MTSEAESTKRTAEKKVSEAVDSVNKTCQSLKELSDKCNEVESASNAKKKIEKEFAKFALDKYKNDAKPIADEIIKIASSTKERLYYYGGSSKLIKWLNEVGEFFVEQARSDDPNVLFIANTAGKYDREGTSNWNWMRDGVEEKLALEGIKLNDTERVWKLLKKFCSTLSEIFDIGRIKSSELGYLKDPFYDMWR